MEIRSDILKEMIDLKDKQDVLELQYRYFHGVEKKDWLGIMGGKL